MTDSNLPVGGASATPNDSPPADEGLVPGLGGGEPSDSPVAPQNLQQMLDAFAAQQQDAIQRLVQSRLDKAEARIARRVLGDPATRISDILSKMGVSIPEDKREQVAAAIKASGVVPNDESDHGDGAEEVYTSEGLPTVNQESVQEAGNRLFSQLGLLSNDPEVKTIRGYRDAKGYYAAIKAAAAAKNARVQIQPRPAAPLPQFPTGGTPPKRKVPERPSWDDVVAEELKNRN